MSEARKRSDWPIVAMVVAPTVLLAGYWGAYFGCTKQYIPHIWGKAGEDYVVLIERIYSNDGLETLFKPAGWVESRLRGIEVRVVTPDDYPEDPIPPEHLRP